MRKISAHGVDLSFDGVTCDGAFGPAFGDHGPKPDILHGKQRLCRKHIGQLAWLSLHGLCVQRIAVQCEVRCFCNNGAGKNCLELGSGLKPLHERQASV